MRDIRGDLQERVKLLEEQIGATQSQFDKVMEQLKLEHQGKLEDLKSDLDEGGLKDGRSTSRQREAFR